MLQYGQQWFVNYISDRRSMNPKQKKNRIADFRYECKIIYNKLKWIMDVTHFSLSLVQEKEKILVYLYLPYKQGSLLALYTYPATSAARFKLLCVSECRMTNVGKIGFMDSGGVLPPGVQFVWKRSKPS